MAVQTAYKITLPQAIIIAKRNGGSSLRQIAAEYGKPITHADIARMLRGIEPKGAEKRKALGLPAYEPMPVCQRHGIAHPGKCPRRRRVAWSDTPIADQPTALLRWRLKNRVKYN